MSDDDLAAQLERAQDEIVGHLATIRRQSAKIGSLTRRTETRWREHAQWQRAHRLFRIWQRATGHTKAQWSVPRFKECLPYLAVYEDETIVRAISGISYDAFETTRKNGTRQKHDSWELLFRSADKLEEWANRAPLSWKDDLLSHAEEVEARR